ncbi:MAG: hypothetical protein GY828_03970, partial [Candidatus Gracilibacteria bacterium]|nr:hypothetical protein [Candidatus Gracilibacteria bacterium]
RYLIAQDVIKELKDAEYSFRVLADKYKITRENVETGSISKELVKNKYKLDELSSEEIIETENGYLILSQFTDEGYEYIFISNQPSSWKLAEDTQGRVLNDKKYFNTTSVQFNEHYQPFVEIVFSNEGADIFGELTQRLLGEQVAIFVGGELLTAPVIQAVILGGKAQITGSYTPESAKKLSNDINTGLVPAPIFLTSEKTIDSKIGSESLEKLVIAGVSGFIIIFLFLMIIYRWSGFVASVALFLY